MLAYCDEQIYRFNNRKMTDGIRFVGALVTSAGKRLIRNTLTERCLSAMLPK
jgi:hypothetical protein